VPRTVRELHSVWRVVTLSFVPAVILDYLLVSFEFLPYDALRNEILAVVKMSACPSQSGGVSKRRNVKLSRPNCSYILLVSGDIRSPTGSPPMVTSNKDMVGQR